MNNCLENEDGREVVLMRLLQASIETMDQESEKMTNSGPSASNIETLANVVETLANVERFLSQDELETSNSDQLQLEIPELRESDDTLQAMHEDVIMNESSPDTLQSNSRQMRAIHPEPASLDSSRHETVDFTGYRVRFASPQLGISQVNKQTRSKTPSSVPTSPSLEGSIEPHEVSKRQLQIASLNGQASSNGKTCKGEIRTVEDGSIEWKDGDQWRPAVFHNSIREKLIKQAEQLGSYDHRRRHGLDPLDITCFHPDQKTWGPDRNHQWPIMPDQLLFRLERRDYPVPDYNVERWIDEGRVVLDIDNMPVKNYRNIPLTLSSEMEAYLMEMIIRMDARIAHKDLRARMPHTVETGTGRKPLLSLSAIGMRMKRFRLENACPPWQGREGSEVLKSFVMSLLSDESLERNSTQELSGLTKLQQEFIKRQGRGQNLPRAGTRKLGPVTRAKREEAYERRWARLKAADKDQNEDSSGGKKRKRGIDPLLDFSQESPAWTAQAVKRARYGSAGPGELTTEGPLASEGGSPNNFSLPTSAPDQAGPLTVEGGSPNNLSLPTSALNQALDTCFTDAVLDTADSDKAGSHEQRSSPSQREPDAASIEFAIQITVSDYRTFLGYDPPPTNPEDSFDTQYNDIQRDFNGQWNREGPPPTLLYFKPLDSP